MPPFVGCLLISFWGDWSVRDAIPPFVAPHSREVLLYYNWVTRVLEMRYRHLWLHIAGRFY